MADIRAPVCYILGLETQIGLGLVREIGRAGIPVVGIAQRAEAIGLSSRYLFASSVVTDPRSDDGIKAIRALGSRYGSGFLIAVSETNVRWLIDHQQSFGEMRPLVPTLQAFETVADKARTIEIARQLGIDIPASVVPQDWLDVESIARSFRFPAVMKWPAPESVSGVLAEYGLPLHKAEYVYDAGDFLKVAARYRPIGRWPLLQEYCAGRGLGQFFFMHQGNAVRRFQHLRIAEWPPEGGFSSVCDALPLRYFADLQAKSIALLQAINWQGVAMVEYRHDKKTGRSCLMEINGRYWGSFPLAVQSGAGFGLLTYWLQGLGKMPELPAVRDNLRCRMLATEVKRLGRILFQSERIQDTTFQVRPWYELARFALDFFRPNVRYYVWSFDDPMPLLADLRNLAR